jgi:hypothetical protein
MGIAAGLLVQPYCQVIWGDLNLSAYPGSTGEKERLAQNLSLSFTQTEDVPSCEFEMVANVDGFDVVSQIRTSPDLLKEIVEVELGYAHLPDHNLKGKYVFAGLDFSTGHDLSVKFTLTSAMKSSWTENKMSFTMEDEISLAEFPAFLQEKAGKGASLIKFQFVGQAAEDASEIMIKTNKNSQTAQNILNETLTEHGMEIRTGDTALDGTVVIGYTASKEGELEKDKPQLDIPPTPAVRRIHILGPGLLENASRKQSFNLGQSETKGGKKGKATSSTETENKEGAGGKTAPIPQQAAAQSSTKEGTSGPSDKPQARSGTTKSKEEQKKDARAAMSEGLSMEIDASFPMVPQVIGMKPNDVLAIPSIQGPGDHIEDYEITSVQYKMDDSGAVMMSISGKRPYIGNKNMLDEGSLASVRGRCRMLTTPDAWNQYYWRQGPDLAWPLQG